ncbi:chorismate mutase [Streptomyces sp. NPDC088745]|uniref:chorismate mutase n=1 Tax=Streptomyces sp. NPDC088745 TaxID=3365884 RepID=UPI0037FDE0BD
MSHATAAPRTGVPAHAPDADAAVLRLRDRIDEIDGRLIALVEERVAVSSEVQRIRKDAGGPHLALSREAQVIGRYRARLGRLGTDLAMLVLRLSRGGTGEG